MRAQATVAGHQASILAATAYVERNLGSEVRAKDVAAAAGLSLYHFHRLFQATVGESARAYTQRRRLTVAGEALLHSNESVLDVALAAGFGSTEAFSRAFKRTYRVSPSQYRRGGYPLLVHLRTPLESGELKHLMGGITMEPDFRTRPAFKVVGINRDFNMSDPAMRVQIPALWAEFVPRMSEIRHHVHGFQFGMGLGWPSARDGDYNYAACIEVDSLEDIPEGMSGREVGEHEYAVFTHRGPLMNLPVTVNYIFGSWLPTSGIRRAKSPDFELYRDDVTPQTLTELEIWLPVLR